MYVQFNLRKFEVQAVQIPEFGHLMKCCPCAQAAHHEGSTGDVKQSLRHS